MDVTFLDSSVETALFLDGEEVFPSFFCDGSGEVFNVVRTCGSIHNLFDVRFFLEQQLLVAGDTFREIVSLGKYLVVRKNGERIYTGDGSRHTFGLGAEHIHVSVEDTHVPFRSGGVHLDLASAVAFNAVSLHNLGPQHTSSTELGNFHEVVGADTEVEFDAFGNGASVEAFFGQSIQISLAISQTETEFLSDVATGVVEHNGVGTKYAEMRQCFGKLQQFSSVFNPFAGFHTLGKRTLEGVEVDATFYIFQVDVVGLQIFNEQFEDVQHLLVAVSEVDFDTFEVDAFEQSCHIFGSEVFATENETQRINALVENVESFGVGGLGVFYFDVLTNQPVVVGLGTTNEGEFAGQGIDAF